MWQNPHFNDIFRCLRERNFSKAINLAVNYFLTHSSHDMETFMHIRQDYELMVDYWRKGFPDSQREALYDRLLRRLYVFMANEAIIDRIRKSSQLSELSAASDDELMNDGFQQLRSRLEDDVTSMAMLELEPEHLRKVKSEEIHSKHQQFMSRVFNTLFTSCSLRDSAVQPLKELLLSPTVDSIDQQLMVSALTISNMMTFCINKFQLLVEVSQKATVENVRQRAFVGWVLSTDSSLAKLYPEIRSTVDSLCSNEQMRRELTELQMQIVYCMQADDDSQMIKNEIMPELIKGNNAQMNRLNTMDMGENSLEDILHPDGEEESVERMEASMKKMAEMGRKGSDIYFAGFSQMKRYPFFYDISNWFVPFYPHHPLISNIWFNTKGGKFLQTVTQGGAFCDSDRYSFVLAFSQVMEHMPKQMFEIVEKGEATPMALGGEVPMEDQRQPAFIRRFYLQNLYRFFRLFPHRSEFVNPFEQQRAIFMNSPLFLLPSMTECITRVASFLVKRGMGKQALELLEKQPANGYTLAYHLLMGQLWQGQALTAGTLSDAERKEAQMKAISHYHDALLLDANHQRALIGYARALFNNHQYEEALGIFRKLYASGNSGVGVELNISVCLIQLNRVDEALKILYRLNYNDPDNDNVNRVLAWAQTLAGTYEQAEKFYGRLTSVERPHADDLLNYGYCLWFQQQVEKAIGYFQQYMKHEHTDLEKEFLHTEYDILKEKGITDIDIQLMLEAVRQ